MVGWRRHTSARRRRQGVATCVPWRSVLAGLACLQCHIAGRRRSSPAQHTPGMVGVRVHRGARAGSCGSARTRARTMSDSPIAVSRSVATRSRRQQPRSGGMRCGLEGVKTRGRSNYNWAEGSQRISTNRKKKSFLMSYEGKGRTSLSRETLFSPVPWLLDWGAAAAPTAIVVHLTLRVLVCRRGYELVEGAFRLLNLRVDHLLASEQLGPVGVLARRAWLGLGEG